MNLAEFVEESLTEILTGIVAGQQKPVGGAIGAGMHAMSDKGLLVSGVHPATLAWISTFQSWRKSGRQRWFESVGRWPRRRSWANEPTRESRKVLGATANSTGRESP